MRVIGLLLLLLASVGAYFAMDSVLWQDDANRRFVPVDAHFVSTNIAVHRGKSTSYTPEATYQYTVDGRMHRSNRLLAFSESGSRTWADSVLAQIDTRKGRGPEGLRQATAYVNPNNADESVLVRVYTFTPYVLSTAALSIAVIGLGMLLGLVGAGRKTMAAVALDDSGWQLLLPRQQLRGRFWNSFWWVVGAAAALLPMPAHWMLIAGQRTVTGWVSTAVAGGILIGLLIIMVRRWILSRHMSDARLRAKPVPMQRGQTFAVEMEADAYTPLRVQQAVAHIVCLEHYRERRNNKTVYGTRTKEQRSLGLCTEALIPAGQVIEGKGEAFIESDELPGSSDPPYQTYPYYTWEIRLAIKLEAMVDYSAVFPVDVV